MFKCFFLYVYFNVYVFWDGIYVLWGVCERDWMLFVRNSRWRVFCPFLMQSQAESVDHITDAIFMQKYVTKVTERRELASWHPWIPLRRCERGQICNTHGNDWLGLLMIRWLRVLWRRWNALNVNSHWYLKKLSLISAYQHFNLGSCIFF